MPCRPVTIAWSMAAFLSQCALSVARSRSPRPPPTDSSRRREVTLLCTEGNLKLARVPPGERRWLAGHLWMGQRTLMLVEAHWRLLVAGLAREEEGREQQRKLSQKLEHLNDTQRRRKNGVESTSASRV